MKPETGQSFAECAFMLVLSLFMAALLRSGLTPAWLALQHVAAVFGN